MLASVVLLDCADQLSELRCTHFVTAEPSDTSEVIVDFHFYNYAFCKEQRFDARKTSTYMSIMYDVLAQVDIVMILLQYSIFVVSHCVYAVISHCKWRPTLDSTHEALLHNNVLVHPISECVTGVL